MPNFPGFINEIEMHFLSFRFQYVFLRLLVILFQYSHPDLLSRLSWTAFLCSFSFFFFFCPRNNSCNTRIIYFLIFVELTCKTIWAWCFFLTAGMVLTSFIRCFWGSLDVFGATCQIHVDQRRYSCNQDSREGGNQERSSHRAWDPEM